MSTQLATAKKGFGTLPVFLATISTILGAILFLRFGYAVGNWGFWGTIGIIVIGHVVTIATALAVSEIATNQKVEGGGAYFIISRSFGINIGAAIGVGLYLAQAISIAFYVIAFAEAFQPVLDWLATEKGIIIPDIRLVSLPAMGLLMLLMLTKGADLGVKVLYFVCFILFVSIVIFFLGSTDYVPPVNSSIFDITHRVKNPDSFFYVFTIIFPAFTGIAAGLGLSGDLRDPKKSIPLGTLLATLVGMVVYIFITYKLSSSASPEDLANNQFVMSDIALWGPAIPIGLAAATISSALGSVLIAPRTLQALAGDKIFPTKQLNEFFAKEKGAKKEPFNASVISCLVAIIFVAWGDVNAVAGIISMFFMVTYGAICLVSFLEHFAADPAYRPTFKSRWYLSLIGAVACFYLMFKMDFWSAIFSVIIMVGIYFSITYFKEEKQAVSKIFQGAIFQISRRFQLFLQKANTDVEEDNWRPAVVCIGSPELNSVAGFDMLRWISHRYGYGTYVVHHQDYLSKESANNAQETIDKLLDMTDGLTSKVYFDTIISPSTTTTIAQLLQLPGVSGQSNNTLLFEFSSHFNNDVGLDIYLRDHKMIAAMNFDTLILRNTERGFGFKKNIHIWLSNNDYENANLMILLGFIILGHKDWRRGEIKLFAVLNEGKLKKQREDLTELVREGRLPISTKNIEFISQKGSGGIQEQMRTHSHNADLTITGFRNESIKHEGKAYFDGYEGVGNMLFVNTQNRRVIG